MQDNAVDIAKKMAPPYQLANERNLHPGLSTCLIEIDTLCKRVNSRLRSAQIVATVLFSWRNANPGVPPGGAY
jgi:hypothetical protein